MPRKLPKPRTWVHMVMPRFKKKVQSGEKTRTIRSERKDKRRPIPGDFISLRVWRGRPYRTKQKVIYLGCIVAVRDVHIRETGLLYLGKNLYPLCLARQDAFAQRDGFASYGEFLDFFRDEHGLPFHGVLIEWVARA